MPFRCVVLTLFLFLPLPAFAQKAIQRTGCRNGCRFALKFDPGQASRILAKGSMRLSTLSFSR